MSQIEKPAADTSTEAYPSAQYWIDQLDHSKNVAESWVDRGVKVVQRYRDERDNAMTSVQESKFNILWSNVQVLRPSLYGRAAKPEVSRRYADSDPVGRLASTMLERVLEYETSQFPDFDSAMNSVVLDRLLPGRGVAWLRFEPIIVSEAVSTAPVEGEQVTSTEDPVEAERIDEAHSPVDYVYWKDFRHSPARVWDEVWWVARAVYMTKDQGVTRFGAKYGNVPLKAYQEDNSKNPKDRADNNQFAEKGRVWEIWDKRTGKVCWYGEGWPHLLDEKDDPLHLEGFFPCPRPLYATITNGSLIPVPDYVEYQDQARELDDVTGRLTMMVKAVKANGVYNAEFKELGRLLSETTDNTLVPVTSWGNLSEKGGLKGAVDFLDLTHVVQSIAVLSKQRDSLIQTIYEISGISDVMRGSTKAEETLGAQQLKANFAGLRLKPSQADVARFASDIFRIKAQIICAFYPADLIVKMSGIASTDDGRNPQFLSAALQLLAQSTARDFHINVESDSLAQIDDDAEKSAATEAITAIGAFLEKALPAVQSAPQILPMISEMLLFLTRRFRAGRPLESSIEQAMKQLQMAAAQPKGPTKEQIDAQTQAQIAQVQAQAQAQAAQAKAAADGQAQTMKLEAEGRLEHLKMQMEQQTAAFNAKIAEEASARETELEKFRIQSENDVKLRIAASDDQTKLEIANRANATTLRVAMISSGKGDTTDGESLATTASVDAAANNLANRFEAMIPQPKHEELASAILGINDTISKLMPLLARPEPVTSPAPMQPSIPEVPTPFNLAGPEPTPPAESPVAAVHIVKRVPIRGADGIMTGVSVHYSDGSEKKHKIVRNDKGRMVELVSAE